MQPLKMRLNDYPKAQTSFTGDKARQVTQEFYYGGGGGVFCVHDLDSALEALHEIVGQGEGVDRSIFDGVHYPKG